MDTSRNDQPRQRTLLEMPVPVGGRTMRLGDMRRPELRQVAGEAEARAAQWNEEAVLLGRAARLLDKRPGALTAADRRVLARVQGLLARPV